MGRPWNPLGCVLFAKRRPRLDNQITRGVRLILDSRRPLKHPVKVRCEQDPCGGINAQIQSRHIFPLLRSFFYPLVPHRSLDFLQTPFDQVKTVAVLQAQGSPKQERL